jgi:hypothetical protein
MSSTQNCRLTHEELAARLKMEVLEVHRRRRNGEIPYLLLGQKVIRYQWANVLAAFQKLERTGPVKASPNPKARKEAANG